VRLAGILALIAVLAGGCRSEGLTVLSESDLPEDVYGSPAPTPAQTPEIPLQGTVYLVRGDRLWAHQGSLQSGVADSLGEALILALITASPPDNPGRVTNEIPPNTRLNEVRIEGVVATVDLSSEFEGAAPTEIQRLRIAQVVYTLTEDTGILGVEFEVEGFPAPVVEPDRPANRVDFREFAPQGSG
jgi:hypothetical protein